MLAIAVLSKLKETTGKFNIDTNLEIVGSMIYTFGPDAQLRVPSDQKFLSSLIDATTTDMEQRYPLSKLICYLYFNEMAQILSV
jgi:hypothetical protein